MARFFVDTAYALALLDPRDAYHKRARELLPQLRNAHEVWITEAILIEIGNSLACANRIAAVSFINSCYVTANVKVVSIDKELLRRSIEFYHLHDDKEWGLTDCISFVVMKKHNLMYRKFKVATKPRRHQVFSS